MIVEDLIGNSVSPGFSWSLIEVGDGLMHLVPGDLPENCSFRKRRSQEAVGVLIDTPFPG